MDYNTAVKRAESNVLMGFKYLKKGKVEYEMFQNVKLSCAFLIFVILHNRDLRSRNFTLESA